MRAALKEVSDAQDLDSLEGPKAQKVRVSRNDHVRASLQGALQHVVVVTVRGHRIETFGRIHVPRDALDESVGVFELSRCAMKLVAQMRNVSERRASEMASSICLSSAMSSSVSGFPPNTIADL